MNFQLRKHKILEMLNLQAQVEVAQLAEKIGISEITIRRDLNILHGEGLLLRTHGGAVKKDFNPPIISFYKKAEVNADAKEEIAKKAANLISEGDIVFLDCGSTVFRICKYLKSKKIRLVTNSLPVLNELLGTSVIVNFAGGEIDANRKAAHGSMAIEHIKRYNADKAFVGVDGISIEFGLSANSEKETEMTLTMLSQAKTTYFLCDSSKFEQQKYFEFGTIAMVKNIISDSLISADIIQMYEKVGIVFY